MSAGVACLLPGFVVACMHEQCAVDWTDVLADVLTRQCYVQESSLLFAAKVILQGSIAVIFGASPGQNRALHEQCSADSAQCRPCKSSKTQTLMLTLPLAERRLTGHTWPVRARN